MASRVDGEMRLLHLLEELRQMLEMFVHELSIQQPVEVVGRVSSDIMMKSPRSRP